MAIRITLQLEYRGWPESDVAKMIWTGISNGKVLHYFSNAAQVRSCFGLGHVFALLPTRQRKDSRTETVPTKALNYDRRQPRYRDSTLLLNSCNSQVAQNCILKIHWGCATSNVDCLLLTYSVFRTVHLVPPVPLAKRLTVQEETKTLAACIFPGFTSQGCRSNWTRSPEFTCNGRQENARRNHRARSSRCFKLQLSFIGHRLSRGKLAKLACDGP